MKKNILFFTFLAFAMINHMQAQQFNLSLIEESSIYDVTIHNDDNWYLVEGSSDHIGDDIEAIDLNKKGPNNERGDYELDENSNAYAYAGFYGHVLSVTTTEDDNYSYGNRVILRSLDNNKFALLYAHLSEINVQKGDIVHPGDKIGKVGKSGLAPSYYAHLHLVLWKNIDNPTALENMENGHPPSGSSLGNSNEYAAKFNNNILVSNYQTPTNTVNVTSPANNATDIDPLNAELDWDVFTGADRYHVQVSTQPDINPSTGGLLNPDVTSTFSNLYSAHRPNLQGHTRYYWTVRPIAYIGGYSPIRSFTTGEDTRPNIFPSNLAMYNENNTNQITTADIGDHVYVRVDQNVTPLDHQDLGSYVDIYLSKFPTITNTHSIRLSRVHMNIDSNESSITSQVKVRIPGYAFDGSNYLIAVVDSQNIHQEPDEDDNIQVIPITLNKIHPFIISQSTGSVVVEVNAHPYENLLVVMSTRYGHKFIRRFQGWHKKVHATRCYTHPNGTSSILNFGTADSLTVSLSGDRAQYGSRTVALDPINCGQTARSINSQTNSEFLTSKLTEVKIINLSSLSTEPITKLVDKSTFDIKSLNLPKGFYSIRFADGTTKKIYLK